VETAERYVSSSTARSSFPWGPDSKEAMNHFLARAENDLVSPNTPVEGLGEGAFSVLFDSEDEYKDHALVVFGSGPTPWR
jgi:hypothetical protein